MHLWMRVMLWVLLLVLVLLLVMLLGWWRLVRVGMGRGVTRVRRCGMLLMRHDVAGPFGLRAPPRSFV